MNLLNILSTHAVTPPHTGNGSEPDLLTVWPVFTIILFAAGLMADGFLVANWRRRRQTTPSDTFRVGPKPWGMSELFVATGIALAVFLSVGIVAGLLHLKTPTILTVLAMVELLLLVVLLISLQVGGVNWREAFGLHGTSNSHALVMGAVFFLAILPPLQLLSAARDAIYHLFHLKVDTQDIVQMLLRSNSNLLTGVLFSFAVAVAPLCEETFFRGLAYPALKQRWGTLVALMAVSGMFALIHFHLPSLPLLFALAMGLALAYEYTGSLLTPIVMHALFNLLNAAVLIASRNTP